MYKKMFVKKSTAIIRTDRILAPKIILPFIMPESPTDTKTAATIISSFKMLWAMF